MSSQSPKTLPISEIAEEFRELFDFPLEMLFNALQPPNENPLARYFAAAEMTELGIELSPHLVMMLSAVAAAQIEANTSWVRFRSEFRDKVMAEMTEEATREAAEELHAAEQRARQATRKVKAMRRIAARLLDYWAPDSSLV